MYGECTAEVRGQLPQQLQILFVEIPLRARSMHGDDRGEMLIALKNSSLIQRRRLLPKIVVELRAFQLRQRAYVAAPANPWVEFPGLHGEIPRVDSDVVLVIAADRFGRYPDTRADSVLRIPRALGYEYRCVGLKQMGQGGEVFGPGRGFRGGEI
jgi:hypothetical protein